MNPLPTAPEAAADAACQSRMMYDPTTCSWTLIPDSDPDGFDVEAPEHDQDLFLPLEPQPRALPCGRRRPRTQIGSTTTLQSSCLPALAELAMNFANQHQLKQPPTGQQQQLQQHQLQGQPLAQPPPFQSAVNDSRTSQQTREAVAAAVAAAVETVRPPPPSTPTPSIAPKAAPASATAATAAVVVAPSPHPSLKRRIKTKSCVGFKSPPVETPTTTSPNKKQRAASATTTAAVPVQQSLLEHAWVPPLYSVNCPSNLYAPPHTQPPLPPQQHPMWYHGPMGMSAPLTTMAALTAHEAAHLRDHHNPQTTPSPVSSESSSAPLPSSSPGYYPSPMYPNHGVFEVPSAHYEAVPPSLPTVVLQHPPPMYPYVSAPMAHSPNHPYATTPIPSAMPPAMRHGSPFYPYQYGHHPTLTPYHDMAVHQWAQYPHLHPVPAMHPHAPAIIAEATMGPIATTGGGPFPLLMSSAGNEQQQHHQTAVATTAGATGKTADAAVTAPMGTVSHSRHNAIAANSKVTTASSNIDNMPLLKGSSAVARVTPQNGVSSTSTSSGSDRTSPTTSTTDNRVYVLVQTLHHRSMDSSERADPSSSSHIAATTAATSVERDSGAPKCLVETEVCGVYSTMEEAQRWFDAKQAQTVVVVSETTDGKQVLHLDADGTVQKSLQIHVVTTGKAPPGM